MNRQYAIRFSNGEWLNEPLTFDAASKLIENWDIVYTGLSVHIFDVINEEFV